MPFVVGSNGGYSYVGAHDFTDAEVIGLEAGGGLAHPHDQELFRASQNVEFDSLHIATEIRTDVINDHNGNNGVAVEECRFKSGALGIWDASGDVGQPQSRLHIRCNEDSSILVEADYDGTGNPNREGGLSVYRNAQASGGSLTIGSTGDFTNNVHRGAVDNKWVWNDEPILTAIPGAPPALGAKVPIMELDPLTTQLSVDKIAPLDGAYLDCNGLRVTTPIAEDNTATDALYMDGSNNLVKRPTAPGLVESFDTYALNGDGSITDYEFALPHPPTGTAFILVHVLCLFCMDEDPIAAGRSIEIKQCYSSTVSGNSQLGAPSKTDIGSMIGGDAELSMTGPNYVVRITDGSGGGSDNGFVQINKKVHVVYSI